VILGVLITESLAFLDFIFDKFVILWLELIYILKLAEKRAQKSLKTKK